MLGLDGACAAAIPGAIQKLRTADAKTHDLIEFVNILIPLDLDSRDDLKPGGLPSSIRW